jgi:hypothetical protein
MYLLSVQKSKVTVYKTDLAFKSVDEIYSYESRDSMTVDFFATDKMYHSIDDKYYICDLLTGEAEEVEKDAHVSEVKYESDIPSVLGGKKITLLETESEKTVVLNTSDVIIRVATECDVAKYLIDNDKLIFWDIEISNDDIYFIFCASGCEAIYKYDFENDAFTLHTVLYNDYLLGVGGEYYSFE